MKPKHFLTGVELPRGDLLKLIDLADQLKKERDSGQLRNEFAGKNLALLFEKPSLRTHMSFSLAMRELGGNVIESFSLNRKKEEPEDVGRVVEGYCDAIMLRTHEHSILERMCSKTSIPVINGLSDTHHPCQTLADLLTLKQRFGKLEGLRLAYIGDGNNILHSLMLLLPYLGVDLAYACPKGYEPSAFVLKQAKKLAKEGGGKLESFYEPAKAVNGAHAIYTDVWTSMGFEQEEAAREEAFEGFQVNAELYAKANPKAAIMHCLPMVRGKEITEEIVEHANSAIFQQSENRLHAQKALLLMLLGGKV
jgi:ornithine carbamoyltransferase